MRRVHFRLDLRLYDVLLWGTLFISCLLPRGSQLHEGGRLLPDQGLTRSRRSADISERVGLTGAVIGHVGLWFFWVLRP